MGKKPVPRKPAKKKGGYLAGITDAYLSASPKRIADALTGTSKTRKGKR